MLSLMLLPEYVIELLVELIFVLFSEGMHRYTA